MRPVPCIRDAVAELGDIALRRTSVCGADVEVFADPDRVAQIVANLVRNALQYSPPDTQVEVVVSEHQDQAEILVSDRGPGIPPQRLESIFERFGERGHISSGLGVGLWVVRQLATAMGGSVVAGNNPEGGAFFRVRLPRPAASQPKKTSATA